jgi:hypothetical protein
LTPEANCLCHFLNTNCKLSSTTSIIRHHSHKQGWTGEITNSEGQKSTKSELQLLYRVTLNFAFLGSDLDYVISKRTFKVFDGFNFGGEVSSKVCPLGLVSLISSLLTSPPAFVVLGPVFSRWKRQPPADQPHAAVHQSLCKAQRRPNVSSKITSAAASRSDERSTRDVHIV